MNWLNLEPKTLHSPEYIGCKPAARATWLSVILWCAEQENGGRIVGAREWKARRWQQTCGVTRREIDTSSPLLRWEGDDLLVAFYPAEQESKTIAKREAGKVGGSVTTEKKAKAARQNGVLGWMPDPQANPQAQPEAGTQANPEANPQGNGIVKEWNVPPSPQGGGEGIFSDTEPPPPQEPPDPPPPAKPKLTAELLTRIGAIMGRRASTRFSEKEEKALRKLLPIPEEELRAIERYYGARIPESSDFRRHDLITLLNNWHGELDRARNYREPSIF